MQFSFSLSPYRSKYKLKKLNKMENKSLAEVQDEFFGKMFGSNPIKEVDNLVVEAKKIAAREYPFTCPCGHVVPSAGCQSPCNTGMPHYRTQQEKDYQEMVAEAEKRDVYGI